MQIMVDIYISM